MGIASRNLTWVLLAAWMLFVCALWMLLSMESLTMTRVAATRFDIEEPAELFDEDTVRSRLDEQLRGCIEQFKDLNETRQEEFLYAAITATNLTAADVQSVVPEPCILPFVFSPFAVTSGDEKQLHNDVNNTNSSASLRDVTFLTQGGISRADRLVLQLARWKGPASVALYLNRANDTDAVLDFMRQLHSAGLLDRTTISFVYEPPVPSLGYPHNVLRNVVLNHSRTDFYLLFDGDFMLPFRARDKLMGLFEVNPEIEAQLRDRMLFIVPAFEFQPPTENTFKAEAVPNTTAHVIDLLTAGDAQPFYNDTSPGAHLATDFPKWLGIAEKNRRRLSNHSHRVSTSYGDWVYSEPPSYAVPTPRGDAEPYVMGLRATAPRFRDGFRQWGFDRYTWVMELKCVKHRFSVLTDFFAFHLNHNRSGTSTSKFAFFKRNVPIMNLFKEYKTKMGC